MDDAYWKEVLLGVYEHLRIQQETLLQLAVGVDALVKTMAESDPKFAQNFDRQSDLSMQGPLGHMHTAALKAIDLSIAGLREPPKRVN